MNSPKIPLVVELLRAELAAYGGLLAAFDRQQIHLLRREIDESSDTSAVIQDLAAEATEYRTVREAWVAEFAREHNQPEGCALRQMIGFFEADQQPLVEALIKEINVLIHRVRRRARQNHSILARALELRRELQAGLGWLPSSRTYAPSGRVSQMIETNSLRATG